MSVDPSGMSSTDGLKALHDRLLAEKPEGAAHDKEECPLCAMEVTPHTTGGSMPETFTQDELDAAVATSTADLRKRLAELEAQVQETEVGRAVAEATQAKDTEISKLQEQLDAVTAARTAAETKLGEVEEFWAAAITEHEAAVELAARKEQRIADAKAAGVFDDQYIADNADRFAAMSDDDFKARLDEWRLIARQTGPSVPAPARTALVASAARDPKSIDPLSLLTELRATRVDPRTLTGGM